MEQYLTTKEACGILKVSRQTLNTWKKKRKIKSSKICGTIRYKLSDIEAMVTKYSLKKYQQ